MPESDLFLLTSGGAVAVSAQSPLPIMPVGYDGDLDAYAGIGAMGPYAGMVATTSSPIILATVRNTSSRLMKVRQFSLQPLVTTVYAVASFKSIAVRKVEAYTAMDTGGTDVSSYFGARKKSASPALSGVSVRVAGTPGTATNTGLVAGTRTPLNPVFQTTFYVSAVAAQTPIEISLDEPIVLVQNEGVEFILILSASDTTGSMSFTTQFDFTMEDN